MTHIEVRYWDGDQRRIDVLPGVKDRYCRWMVKNSH